MYGKLQKRLIEKPGLAFQRFSLFNKINNMVQFHLENYQDVTVYLQQHRESYQRDKAVEVSGAA